VFEKGALRIFGPKRDEVTGCWRKLHNEELHNFTCRMAKSRIMKWAGNIVSMTKNNEYRKETARKT
jgi:hypothetical protein